MLLRPATICYPIIVPSSAKSAKMALNMNIEKGFIAASLSSSSSSSVSNCSSSSSSGDKGKRKVPILLFDIMDTIVRDPFYHDVTAFFRMSLKELIECKHPTAWIEFEKGLIDEMELARIFFKDERTFDLEGLGSLNISVKLAESSYICTQGLKDCMRRGYSYIEGVEALLKDLKQNNYEMHAFTNYPIWYNIIEDKLKLSSYLSWTFCSCITGKRKPDPDFYSEVLKHLQVEPASCIFIDDRLKNVEAAVEAGIIGLQFKNADLLRRDLSLLGIEISKDEHNDAKERSGEAC